MLATASAWKNSVNATVEGVGILIVPRALKSLNSMDRIQPRMVVVTFTGNPRVTIISCNSPSNVSEETELIAFYDVLSSLVHSISKHNILSIGGNMKDQTGKNGNHKFSLHNSSNRNGQHLTDFTIKNQINVPSYKLSKKGGKTMNLHIPKQYLKAQIDYVFINKKWNNSTVNCEAYSSFEGVSTNHRIITAKIQLSLRKNAT